MPTCKLIIRDEVNCKFEGLDLTARKALSKKFKYRVPYAHNLPAVKLGRWDGCVDYFHMGGTTFVNLLPDVLIELYDMGWDVELEDLRDDYHFEFTEVTDQTFASKCWPEGHPHAGEPIILREHQLQVINEFLENIQSLQEVATGAGKTLITAALSLTVEPYGKSIVIVPNKSLVTQTEDDYRNMGLDVGVFYGDRKEFGHTHTICTWQSLSVMLKNTKNDTAIVPIEKFLEGVVCVIVDECHQGKANELKKILTGPMASIPIRWGLTGTVPKEKFEFEAIRCSLGNVVNQISAKTLQDKGILSSCNVNIIQSVEIVEHKSYHTEYGFLVTDPKRLDWIADQIRQIAKTGNTLVLLNRIETGDELMARLPESVFVSGEMKNEKRKQEYSDIEKSDDTILLATYGVAAVGISITKLHNVVLLEPGKSFVRTIQSIGRGLRKGFDKDHVEIWDICATTKYSKKHLTERKAFYTDAQYPFKVRKVQR